MGQKVVPLGQKVIPLGQKVIPLGQKVIPLGQKVVPLGQKVVPLGRKVVPLGQKVRLLAQKVDVLTFNAISIAYFANIIIIKLISGADLDGLHLRGGAHLAPNPYSYIPFPSPLGNFAYSS